MRSKVDIAKPKLYREIHNDPFLLLVVERFVLDKCLLHRTLSSIMTHILVFGASNSSRSINKRLATYAAKQITAATHEILDLNDYEMPLYSIDREQANGIPQLARNFREKIGACDGLIISFAEHNGAYTVAFKNILDWVSRLEGSVFQDKPIVALSTSPGKRGGATVLNIAAARLPFNGGEVVGAFSLPEFNKNFDDTEGILDDSLASDFHQVIHRFTHRLSLLSAE